jgi:DNA polymerase-3 subunit delta
MFYVFDGQDAFTRGQQIASLMASMGDPTIRELNTTMLDGGTTTLNEIRHHCDTMPFLADRRLVLVKGLLERLGQKSSRADNQFLEELIDYLPSMPDTARLIFVEAKTLPQRHPVVQLGKSSEAGHVKTFEVPRGSELARWVRAKAKQADAAIEPQAVQALCTFVGNDLYQLYHEINKLAAYTDGQRAISLQDVQLLTPHARQASIFDMVDAVGRRDGKTASRVYHTLLDAGDHPLALLAMITRQFRLLIQVKELAPQLGTHQAIARQLHQNPYPIKKILAQSKNFTFAQLHHIYHKLLDTDVDIKTGRIDPTLAIDTLIARISPERQDQHRSPASTRGTHN